MQRIINITQVGDKRTVKKFMVLPYWFKLNERQQVVVWLENVEIEEIFCDGDGSNDYWMKTGKFLLNKKSMETVGE